jgi:uncharacterized integral membrane protein
VSRRQGRTGGTVTRGFAAGTGLLARVVYLVVTVVVVIIAAVVYALVGGLITRLLGRPRHYQLKRTHDQQDH